VIDQEFGQIHGTLPWGRLRFLDRNAPAVPDSIGPFGLQGSQVIENFLGRRAALVRCQSLSGNGDIFVGEPVCHVPDVPASGIADLDTSRGLGNELGLLVINDNM